MKEQIQTSAAPAAIGPYAQGIQASGKTLYISGQLPIDPATGVFAGEDIASQTEQSLKNIQAILAQAGASMDNVVKTTVLLKDIADFGAMNQGPVFYRRLPRPRGLSGGCPSSKCSGGNRSGSCALSLPSLTVLPLWSAAVLLIPRCGSSR